MADDVTFTIVTKAAGVAGGAAPGSSPSPGGGAAGPAVINPGAHAPAPVPAATTITPPPFPPPIQPINAPPIQPAGKPGVPILLPTFGQNFQAGQAAVGMGQGFAGMGFGSLAGGVAGGLGAAAMPIAAAAGAAYAFKSAVETFRSTIRSATDQAAPYSGAITAAQARNEALQVFADLRTSQRLGGALARQEALGGRADRAIQEIRDAILAPLLEFLLPFLETGVKWLEAIAKNWDTIEKAAGVVLAAQYPTSWLVNRLLESSTQADAAKQANETDPIFGFEALPWPSEDPNLQRGKAGHSVGSGFTDTNLDPAFIRGGMLP